MTTKADLRDTVKRARSAEGHPVSFTWPRPKPDGDIVVSVTQYPDGNLYLMLERADRVPTGEEWMLLLDAWPEHVPDHITVSLRTEGRKHRMIGHWPRPAVVTEPA